MATHPRHETHMTPREAKPMGCGEWSLFLFQLPGHGGATWLDYGIAVSTLCSVQ
jgi:hypothetical protein